MPLIRSLPGTVGHMARTLAIAAGGGGDAITAAVLARALGFEPAVMAYSWDRLIVDPLPGPRTRKEFEGLAEPAPNVRQVLPTSTVVGPGASTLPALADVLPASLLLLDASGGAAGIAEQIRAAADHIQAGQLAIVDVGGDAVAEGNEPGLRSPLADFLVLAGACRTGLPVQLLVAGVALDAELTEAEVLARVQLLDGHDAYHLTADDFADVRPLFEWHPSEATGLLAAASRGVRGIVETRDHGGGVKLTAVSPYVFSVDGHRALKASAAHTLTDTTTLDGVERAVRAFHGTTELDYERTKAGRLSTRRAVPPNVNSLAELDAIGANSATDFVTVRRAAELLGATSPTATAELRRILAEHRPDRYDPPLYRLRPTEPPIQGV